MATKAMLLGQVLTREVLKPSIINVRVVQQVLDKHLNMFFPEKTDYKVVEGEHKVTPGDIVRIVQLDQNLTVEVAHEIAEIVFPIGRIVDPLTGKRCRGTKFIDEESRKEEAKRVVASKVTDNYAL